MTKCEHEVDGYCDDCVSDAEHIRCYERFIKSGIKKFPEEGVGYQP